ncbi:MAG: alpha/beta fold hydrolase [Synechococcaceae cyanobacterium]|nr:alpha/beta fold hydrolase [Synechococcaceae cyanobacterium]
MSIQRLISRLGPSGAVLVSLLLALAGPCGRPAAAAEVLQLRLDDIDLPIPLSQLEAWSQGRSTNTPIGSDVAIWLNLMAPQSRSDVRRLLSAPLLRERSFGQQVLDSWAGGQVLGEVAALLTDADGHSIRHQLELTLRQLLREHQEVSTITLLRALPVPRLSLQLDGLIAVAQQWRRQLDHQRRALNGLRTLNIPGYPSSATGQPAAPQPQPQLRLLPVSHRPSGLPLQIWPAEPAAARPATRPWLLLMPGLGGDADQLNWLASGLAGRGWPVVVLQHPGSDAAALRAALEGDRPPPGAETLADRLRDVEALLAAQRRGELGMQGQGVVLIGHSLGGLTAMLAAGVGPEAGLRERCGRVLGRLPFTNPSRLLQCQLPSTGLPPIPPRPDELRGLVLYNPFGSLLWPRRALTRLPLPVLIAGGSLDLVTPPLEEQLQLFDPPGHPGSRFVLVEGGSHFSPVRMASGDEGALRLGNDLVGTDPVRVQGVLLHLTQDFLAGLEQPRRPMAGRLQQDGVTAYVLDAPAAGRWRSLTGP